MTVKISAWINVFERSYGALHEVAQNRASLRSAEISQIVKSWYKEFAYSPVWSKIGEFESYTCLRLMTREVDPFYNVICLQ